MFLQNIFNPHLRPRVVYGLPIQGSTNKTTCTQLHNVHNPCICLYLDKYNYYLEKPNKMSIL